LADFRLTLKSLANCRSIFVGEWFLVDKQSCKEIKMKIFAISELQRKMAKNNSLWSIVHCNNYK